MSQDGCPWLGYPMYFPGADWNPQSVEQDLINYFYQHYSGPDPFPSDFLARAVRKSGAIPLTVNFTELRDAAGPQFVAGLKDNAEAVIAANGVAAYQQKRLMELLPPSWSEKARSLKVNPRIVEYDPVTKIKHIKANVISKFVCVRGTVVRVSTVKPMVTKMDFTCERCGTQVHTWFRDGKFSYPSSCANSGCRARTFKPDYANAGVVDWQKIRLQEQAVDDAKDEARVPRTIECELTEDLVDTCVPGDVVKVTGVVKTISTAEGHSSKANQSLYYVYIDTNCLVNQKTEPSTGPLNAEEKLVREIRQRCGENMFRVIAHSICPGIYGHELVKAGLTLALFGGVQKWAADKDKIAVRGDTHCLIVGDPGLGKSQMLQAVANISPRGVYVCGSYSTTSGLTVTLLREGSGDNVLEAGALVLADQGCCCIDEFDKMGQEHASLLEAMEQQSISIAKAGIICSLPARTSVIAAANPVGGHYNKAKTVAENLKLSPAVLSRFDLIFILIDRPDEELDKMLSEHVMAMHAGKRVEPALVSQRPARAEDDNRLNSITSRLRLGAGETLDPIPVPLLRKYVAYARRLVPRILPDTAALLQDYYLTLRRKVCTANAAPVTTRQLESLIRLAEARARLELSLTVTVEHAQDVIAVMQESLLATLEDDRGVVDFTRDPGGMSKSNIKKRFVAYLHRVSRREETLVFSFAKLVTLARDMGIATDGTFDEFIESLNQQGYLLKKRNREYELTGT